MATVYTEGMRKGQMWLVTAFTEGLIKGSCQNA